MCKYEIIFILQVVSGSFVRLFKSVIKCSDIEDNTFQKMD